MIRKARFPADQRSVLHARRLVSDAVVDVPDHVSEALALITSELATNAVRHGPSGFEIRIEQRSDCIHIEVEDDGGGAPIVRAPGLSETSGRGLQIVSSGRRVGGDPAGRLRGQDRVGQGHPAGRR